MIKIYKADSKRFRKQNQLTKLLDQLPQQYRSRALRYKFEQDSYNFTLGRYLLKTGLKELGLVNELENISYQENGKPVLENVFFNISHTENLVVCALSTQGAIGIDVEKEKPIILENFNPWFTSKEWADINDNVNSINRFYWYWTRKESIIKALGINLSHLHTIYIDATQFQFTNNQKKWYLAELDFGPGYTGSLCSEFRLINKKFQTVNPI